MKSLLASHLEESPGSHYIQTLALAKKQLNIHLFREVAKFSVFVFFLCWTVAAYYSRSMASSKFVRPPKIANTYEFLPFPEVKMQADGNCLFRALSDQLYFDEGRHYLKVREVNTKMSCKIFLIPTWSSKIIHLPTTNLMLQK